MGGPTVSATETVDFLSLRMAAISSESGLINAGGNSDVMVLGGLISCLVLVALRTRMDPETLAQLERRVGARMSVSGNSRLSVFRTNEKTRDSYASNGADSPTAP